MAFDVKNFMATTFEPRTASVPVPNLKDWFDEGEEPVWVVRGQTASEVARANTAAEKNKNIDSIAKAIAQHSEQVKAIKAAVGVVDDTPADTVKRLEQLVQCSVEPKITLDAAVKLSEVRAIEFYMITNEIVMLTAQGSDVKKRPASGKNPKSEP